MINDPSQVVTERQLELIALYASGYKIKQIGAIKFLSYDSVKQYLAEAKFNTGAQTLTHLCVLCMEAGLLAKEGNLYIPIQEERIA